MLRTYKTIAALLILASSALSFAQTQPAPGGGGGGGGGGAGGAGGGFRNFDPAAIRERIMQGVKTAVDCSDDEWKVLEPKLVKVMLLRMDTGEFGMLTGRGGSRMRSFIRTMLDPNAPPSLVDERLDELQKMIEENETSNDFYRNKVAQLRKAREKVREDLKIAQHDLTVLLTLKQEAALVQLGVLD